MRSAVLRPTPGILREAGDIAGANGGDKFFDAHAGENFERQRRPDSGSTEQQLEEMFFAGRKKSVERKSVFADVRMNQQCDFSVQFAERSIGRKRDGNQIAHAADIYHDLVGSFIGESAAELSNHRSPVLPLSLRPSTRLRDRG